MKYQCEHCEGLNKAEDSEVGKEIACGHCKKTMILPAPFTPSSVIDDFVIREKVDRGFKCHQMSLGIDVILRTLQSSDKDAILKFVNQGREKAQTGEVHAIGHDGDVYYTASRL